MPKLLIKSQSSGHGTYKPPKTMENVCVDEVPLFCAKLS